MKYLKISIRSNGSNMIYPEKYEMEIGKFVTDHIYYEDGIYCKLLLCFLDKDFNSKMIRTDVEEITEVEAKMISETKETRTEIIKDETKLRRIELKTKLGQTLTKEEIDCTDITNPNSLFGKTEILSDRIEKLKIIETKSNE